MSRGLIVTTSFVVSSYVALRCRKSENMCCAVNSEGEMENKCVEVGLRNIGHVYLSLHQLSFSSYGMLGQRNFDFESETEKKKSVLLICVKKHLLKGFVVVSFFNGAIGLRLGLLSLTLSRLLI